MKISPIKKTIGKTKVGQTMEVKDKAGRLLVKVGLAREVVDEPVTVAKPEVRISPATGKPVRQYSRRDMRAED